MEPTNAREAINDKQLTNSDAPGSLLVSLRENKCKRSHKKELHHRCLKDLEKQIIGGSEITILIQNHKRAMNRKKNLNTSYCCFPEDRFGTSSKRILKALNNDSKRLSSI